MSINLHCKEVELWQTPTFVTFMLFNERYDDGKKDWKAIRDRYIFWLMEKKRTYGQEKNTVAAIEEHIEEIRSCVTMEFYII